ncbi:MAG TPA: UDP-N-acetylglucosamine 2-epimerase (non-hydrolyzing) [Solibacterales bacterium]|nr:UDP-N-acetylglucosamine 2-epimerase (non-hydrolyzing) [Bryobacterales bacterium]
MRKVLLIFGTRPEAVKLCPVILSLRARPHQFETRVCVTAQHREMLDQVLAAFDIEPDHDLNLMQAGQSLSQTTARTIAALEQVIAAERPDLVVVQGDTTTTFCGALAAFQQRVPVAHVEAGLRTGDILEPYPEEMHRLLTSRLASLHLAATEEGARHLRREGIPEETIAVTGQSGIDAMLHIRERLERGELPGRAWPELDPERKLLVATAHRRESFGHGIEQICDAIGQLADRRDVQVVFPVHPNPGVEAPVRERLGGHRNVVLCEPLGYVPFIDLLRRCYFVLTDSGGVQEEAPSLGKPVLVMRAKTERPEAVAAGTSLLVGADTGRIVAAARRLLEEADYYSSLARVHHPFGDGRASHRIADAIASFQAY